MDKEKEFEEYKEYFKELDELCKPVVEYLRKNFNPHTEIVIATDFVTVKQSILGSKQEYPDNDSLEIDNVDK